VTTLDQRIGAWLFFTLLCNYLDRGYKVNGFASSLDALEEKDIIAKWSPFVVSDQQVLQTFGFQPDPARFHAALESMHYHVQYDQQARAWHITPPIFRFDIIHPIDILEDYFVATHYEEASPTPLLSTNPIGSQTKRSELEDCLIDYMQVYGARQTIGLLLDSYENLVDRMCHDAPERLIHLVNAVNKNREYAVDSSLPPLLRNAVHPSAPHPPTTFYLFTETLFQDEHKVAHSRWNMGILLVGTDHPFNNAHTLLDALCYHLRLDCTLIRSSSPALIPGRQMTITAGETPIGQFGEVHPEILTRWELFYPASFIELDLDTITEMWVGRKSGA
jgi:phenylalanyl-tRNA synthetase beta subunit